MATQEVLVEPCVSAGGAWDAWGGVIAGGEEGLISEENSTVATAHR